MKIAVISDIHGNIRALDAVLADITRQGVDEIVNLGDILSGPLRPRETAERLMPLALPTIRGNHERQLLTFAYDDMEASDRHAVAELRPNQLDWIASLPASLRLWPEVLLVHGSPSSDLTCFLETITEDGMREATNTEVEERAGSADAAVILCGHTHVPRVVQLEDGRLIVNPGSVGLPAYSGEYPYAHRVENGSPHARYAIIHASEAGWSADLIAVEYDWEAAAHDAEANGRADWARALRTGQA